MYLQSGPGCPWRGEGNPDSSWRGGTRISSGSRDPKIIFVTGGSRSGKSTFAKRLAESVGDRLFYVATAQPLDDEMRERIRKHKAERSDRWQTVEEPVDLAGALLRLKGEADAIVVDCMGLWISNLLTGGSDASRAIYLSEDDALSLAVEAVSAAKSTRACVIFVSNEVGLGIVPEDALGRAFRDALGRVNQVLAEMSDDAYLLISGKAIPLKKAALESIPACGHEPSSGSAFASETEFTVQEMRHSYPWWHPLGPLRAFTFLTRIPLPGRLRTLGATEMRPGYFRPVVVWFGAVGFLLGAILAGSDYIMTVMAGIEAPIAAAIQLTLLFLLTGGLHVDGLADT
ncbi:MAG TPA: bifunctional adenosylcobinamide kinase/adenosylcobinamide-phosphate guanylyltransferase, partial [Clostridia bacterium]|nr:bifunctional adenosylcobinamide kinase/adenosylcobinamide-phosphate guanylyltransferase [Clostridia bacterium]